jgi:flagellar biosynthesis protein FlhG
LSVTGGKGGVGKSTLAINLAVAYARRGSRTLALDGDLGMADLNLLLGLAPARSLLDVLGGGAIEEVLIAAHGIHLLPALNGSYRLANLDSQARAKLFTAIGALSERFDTLVVDTAAGIGESTVALAGAAADVVVVATPEPLSLADAYACLKVLATRQGLSRALVLPNAVRSPTEGEEVLAKLSALVSRFLGISIVPLPAVPQDPNCSLAAAAGVPLLLHSPDSPASRAIRRVAQRIDALAQSHERPGGLRGWLERGHANTGGTTP